MTQEVSVKGKTIPEPKFIKYLMDPEQEYDCYFLVGNTDHSEPEKIGAVKKMLLAHSTVLRAELQESKMKETGVVQVSDLFPDTFKNLLRFVYGFDNTPTLCFDEADNLLYAAEKYMVTGLKSRLVTRFTQLLSPDNICSLMNNPACYTDLELNDAITEILQTETARVLASPQFLDLVGPAFTHILEQEALSVPEIELWRAAVKWAKHKTGSEDPQVLRKQLAVQSKKIWICSVPLEDFCSDIVTSAVLTHEEVNTVCLSHGQKRKQDGLVDFSNKMEPRKRMCRIDQMNIPSYFGYFTLIREAEHTINAKGGGLKLLSFKMWADNLPLDSTATSYNCDCTVEILCPTLPNMQFTTIVFKEQVEFDRDFVIPISSDGQSVTLLPNANYIIKVKYSVPHVMYKYTVNTLISNNHLSLTISKTNYSPIKMLTYRPLLSTIGANVN